MLAETIFYATTEYPGKAGNAIDVTSIGSEIGDSGAHEYEWPEPAFVGQLRKQS